MSWSREPTRRRFAVVGVIVRRFVVVVVVLLAACVFAAGGCAGSKGQDPAGGAGGNGGGPRGPIDPARLQVDVMNYADSFVTTMTDAYDALEAASISPVAKRAALSRKIGTATGAFINASNTNPIAGLMDMMVLVSLQREASDDPWFRELFGPAGDEVCRRLAEEEAQLWDLAGQYLTRKQLEEMRAAIAHWRASHPDQRYVALTRLSDFPEAHAAAASADKAPGSIFSLLFLDPFANLSPAVREIAQSRVAAARMFFYAQRMPAMLRWQAQSLYLDVAADPRFDEFIADTGRFSDATASFSASVKKLPDDMARLRENTVNQTAAALTKERTAALVQASDLLNQHQRTLTTNATALTDHASELLNQQQKTLATNATALSDHASDLLRRQQDVLAGNANAWSDHTVDRLARNLFFVGAALSVLVALLVLLVRRLGRRDRDQVDPAIAQTSVEGPSMRRFSVLVLVLLLCVAAAPLSPPTIGDAQADFAAQKYQPCLQKISQILAGPTAKPGSQLRYDLFLLRGECLMQLRQADLAASAFQSAAVSERSNGRVEQFAAAQAATVLIKASPGLRYKPRVNPTAEPIDIVSAEGRKTAMLALLEDRLDESGPRIAEAMKGISLVPMQALVPGILDTYMLELAATGKTDRTMTLAKSLGGRARELIKAELDRTIARLDGLQDIANSPAVGANGYLKSGYQGLNSHERDEVKDMAELLMKIESVAQDARRLSRRLGGTPEAWDAILADCTEAKQTAQRVYDRRY